MLVLIHVLLLRAALRVVDEDRPAQIEVGLPGAPALTPTGYVGTGRLKSEQCFFEPKPFAQQELPNGVVRYRYPTSRQLILQPM